MIHFNKSNAPQHISYLITRGSILLVIPLLASLLIFANVAHAATVSYYLDQTNRAILPDGSSYLKVTMNDNDLQTGQIDFLIETLPGAFTEGTDFGIQAFGFNFNSSAVIDPISTDDFLIPESWTVDIAPPLNTLGGFGDFDILLSNDGNSRQEPLQFSLITNGTLDDFIVLSSGAALQGNVLFVANVAGFISPRAGRPGVTSAWFGGSEPAAVPVPAALWLFGSGLLGLTGVARRKAA